MSRVKVAGNVNVEGDDVVLSSDGGAVIKGTLVQLEILTLLGLTVTPICGPEVVALRDKDGDVWSRDDQGLDSWSHDTAGGCTAEDIGKIYGPLVPLIEQPEADR